MDEDEDWHFQEDEKMAPGHPRNAASPPAGANAGDLRCMVKGCQADLSQGKAYFKRFRVCEMHLKSQSLCVGGRSCRFCQQCGKFHAIEEFDGQKRNCRRALMTRYYKRRKLPTPAELLEAGGADGQPFGADSCGPVVAGLPGVAWEADPSPAPDLATLASLAEEEEQQQVTYEQRRRGRPRAPRPLIVEDSSGGGRRAAVGGPAPRTVPGEAGLGLLQPGIARRLPASPLRSPAGHPLGSFQPLGAHGPHGSSGAAGMDLGLGVSLNLDVGGLTLVPGGLATGGTLATGLAHALARGEPGPAAGSGLGALPASLAAGGLQLVQVGRGGMVPAGLLGGAGQRNGSLAPLGSLTHGSEGLVTVQLDGGGAVELDGATYNALVRAAAAAAANGGEPRVGGGELRYAAEAGALDARAAAARGDARAPVWLDDGGRQVLLALQQLGGDGLAAELGGGVKRRRDLDEHAEGDRNERDSMGGAGLGLGSADALARGGVHEALAKAAAGMGGGSSWDEALAMLQRQQQQHLAQQDGGSGPGPAGKQHGAARQLQLQGTGAIKHERDLPADEPAGRSAFERRSGTSGDSGKGGAGGADRHGVSSQRGRDAAGAAWQQQQQQQQRGGQPVALQLQLQGVPDLSGLQLEPFGAGGAQGGGALRMEQFAGMRLVPVGGPELAERLLAAGLAGGGGGEGGVRGVAGLEAALQEGVAGGLVRWVPLGGAAVPLQVQEARGERAEGGAAAARREAAEAAGVLDGTPLRASIRPMSHTFAPAIAGLGGGGRGFARESGGEVGVGTGARHGPRSEAAAAAPKGGRAAGGGAGGREATDDEREDELRWEAGARGSATGGGGAGAGAAAPPPVAAAAAAAAPALPPPPGAAAAAGKPPLFLRSGDFLGSRPHQPTYAKGALAGCHELAAPGPSSSAQEDKLGEQKRQAARPTGTDPPEGQGAGVGAEAAKAPGAPGGGAHAGPGLHLRNNPAPGPTCSAGAAAAAPLAAAAGTDSSAPANAAAVTSTPAPAPAASPKPSAAAGAPAAGGAACEVSGCATDAASGGDDGGGGSRLTGASPRRQPSGGSTRSDGGVKAAQESALPAEATAAVNADGGGSAPEGACVPARVSAALGSNVHARASADDAEPAAGVASALARGAAAGGSPAAGGGGDGGAAQGPPGGSGARAARVLAGLSTEQQLELLQLLPHEQVVDLLPFLPLDQQLSLLSALQTGEGPEEEEEPAAPQRQHQQRQQHQRHQHEPLQQHPLKGQQQLLQLHVQRDGVRLRGDQAAGARDPGDLGIRVLHLGQQEQRAQPFVRGTDRSTTRSGDRGSDRGGGSRADDEPAPARVLQLDGGRAPARPGVAEGALGSWAWRQQPQPHPHQLLEEAGGAGAGPQHPGGLREAGRPAVGRAGGGALGEAGSGRIAVQPLLLGLPGDQGGAGGLGAGLRGGGGVPLRLLSSGHHGPSSETGGLLGPAPLEPVSRANGGLVLLDLPAPALAHEPHPLGAGGGRGAGGAWPQRGAVRVPLQQQHAQQQQQLQQLLDAGVDQQLALELLAAVVAAGGGAGGAGAGDGGGGAGVLQGGLLLQSGLGLGGLARPRGQR